MTVKNILSIIPLFYPLAQLAESSLPSSAKRLSLTKATRLCPDVPSANPKRARLAPAAASHFGDCEL